MTLYKIYKITKKFDFFLFLIYSIFIDPIGSYYNIIVYLSDDNIVPELNKPTATESVETEDNSWRWKRIMFAGLVILGIIVGIIAYSKYGGGNNPFMGGADDVNDSLAAEDTKARIDSVIISLTSPPLPGESVGAEKVENVEADAITAAASTNTVQQIPEAVPVKELTTDEMLNDQGFLDYIKYKSKEDFYTRMKYSANKSYVDSVTKHTYEEYISMSVNNQKATQNE